MRFRTSGGRINNREGRSETGAAMVKVIVVVVVAVVDMVLSRCCAVLVLCNPLCSVTGTNGWW